MDGGHPDYAVTRDRVIAHLTALVQAVDLPVNADFESGFGADGDEIAGSVVLAIETVIAGLSIEDRDPERSRLYDTPTALERLRAARDAIDTSGQDVLLVARTEVLLIDPVAVNVPTEKLVAFAEAGADCLYASGVRSREDICAMVRAIAPKPLNVHALDTDVTLAELADLGVRRVSVGGASASVGCYAVVRAAKGIRDGSFSDLANRMPGDTLRGILGGARPQQSQPRRSSPSPSTV